MEESTATMETPQRPQFLKVLCIISYVFSGIGALMLAAGYFGMSYMKKQIEAGTIDVEQMGDSANIQKAMDMLPHMNLIFGVGFLTLIISLVGVIMMWKLMKTGFYVYLMAQVVGTVAPILVMGTEQISWFGIILGFVFTVLFAMNLKHMK